MMSTCVTTRNVFLSSAADGELRVYTLHNTKPLTVIHSSVAIIMAAWSVTRDSCMYVLQEDGLLVVYNFQQRGHTARPQFVVPLDQFTTAFGQKALLFSLNRNEKREQLALVSTAAETWLWELSGVLPAELDRRTPVGDAQVS